jgi:predicted glycoside hydrolase/deacetylase ChbG (UPF0249 family)
MLGVAATTDASLIINADDFGMTEGINRGIIEAFDAGAVTSTSVMVGMPAFADAVRRARAAGDGLGVGVHFTLTAGRPLTRAPSLVNRETGAFLSIRTLLVRALSGRVRAREVVEECAAQIARARDAGLRLTHLDGHHHVHIIPGISGAVRQAVQAEHIPAVRRPVERLVGGPDWRRRLVERAVIDIFARGVHPERWHVGTTEHFCGVTLLGAPRFHSAMVRALDCLPKGTTELMVHPGYVPGPLPGGDAYTTQREIELRALTSPEVLERLHSGRIRLMHFGELRGVG